ncbi:uncharacterized protein LOC133778294 [Humulus lupulus]|uniref:uncharacterized protein LOC133778294 n=1 Tax=Humulus lupulus TaxID=3486 RepID=UPI002B40C8E8|nr:uncharacterized protein LOC133778294 [Humulus lupulus]XP_062074159.1 uncharacterized protein LOC133778294 [Humulus lupulus]XP_062074160.1 uncharacterized protein LOC133778294 [Humulus lupulus]
MDCDHRNHRVTKDDVISKLKDDGDFDKLRLSIIRKLKDHVELREKMSSIVRQSAALTRLGAENMKPRQLSDAIYQEVGDKLMSQISDGLWGIIRSNDVVKTEIKETVHSVYKRLTSTEVKVEVESSTSQLMPVQKKNKAMDSILVPASKAMLSENEPNEPPGFSLSHKHLKRKIKDLQPSSRHEKRHVADQQGVPVILQEKHERGHVDHGQSPSFSVRIEHQKTDCCSDEDPDVPPGFG